MQFKGFRVLSCMAFFVSSVAFFQAQATQHPCGADASVEAFQQAAEAALEQLPRLDGNVDKCFPNYREETHQTLQSVQATYQNSLENLEGAVSDLQRGQDASFKSVVPKIVAAVTAVNKPVHSNARNLKNYGFTTSDKMVGNRYKYPECNSKVNDRPEENWAATYKAIVSIDKAGKALLASVKCLK